ncbi:MAG: hypothetical protein L7H18_03725 [Candidatus Nealsonbacteria bacterium DGGOD1a]|jgi:hypothetical protein|nr:MAG: hypothetical protein L7H18_03725 [Candidatus Nealsonbacteria bacterium DGGOD1a]
MPLTSEEIAKIQEEERVRAQEREKYAPAQSINITTNTKQKYGVPALLSFFIPGMGQIVKGEVLKGIIAFISFVAGCFLFVIPGIIIWIAQLIDAYNYNPPAK